MLDLGDGPQEYRREVNTMPNWAGSCWYELRYLDPHNEETFCDPRIERYWMGPQHEGDSGGVDLYVGGVEHAVLHLLYARFWHKVLFDLGYVSSFEPYHRLFNQGYIQAAAYTDERGRFVEAGSVVESGDGWSFEGRPVNRQYGKMGKSLKNSVTPDEMYEQYGADTLRLYEMFTGPLDQSRPWDTKAVVGMYRLLQRIWRLMIDEHTGRQLVVDRPADEATRRVLHRTIAAVGDDMASLRFNTAIARISELTNHLTQLLAPKEGPAADQPAGADDQRRLPRDVAEPLVLMLAPLAPHIAEELWSRLGHHDSLAWERFPEADARFLVDDTIEIPVQVNGKVRAKVVVPTGADEAAVEAAARADERVTALLDGHEVKRVVAVPGRLVNFVLA